MPFFNGRTKCNVFSKRARRCTDDYFRIVRIASENFALIVTSSWHCIFWLCVLGNPRNHQRRLSLPRHSMNWSRCIEVLGQTAQETAPLKEDTGHSKCKETGRRRGRPGVREENRERFRPVLEVPYSTLQKSSGTYKRKGLGIILIL